MELTNEAPKQTPEEKALKRKAYMKTYMRDYKKKKYAENPTPTLANNRTRYLKKNVDIDATEASKYGIYLADVIKLKRLMEKVPQTFLKEVMSCP
jgi:hypothetical protein